MTRACAALLLTALAAVPALAQQDIEPTPRARSKEVRAAYEKNLATYKERADALVLPGLVADRTRGDVRIEAEATGLGNGSTVEFILVGERSGRDYEALAVAFATGADIARALRFIGMEPGTPVNPPEMRFWPKGERVRMFFAAESGGSNRVFRAEQAVLDRGAGKPMASTGLVFAGSRTIPSADDPAKRLCAADTSEPGSIAATYNEPTTVFDVPRQAAQGDVYERFVVNPEFLFKQGQRVEVRLEPEYRDGRKRVVDMTLAVAPRKEAASTNAAAIANLVFRLTADGKPRLDSAPINGVLGEFAKLAGNGQDPYVRLSWAPELTLGQVRGLCAMLATIDGEQGIRIEPPEPGSLYYKAFIPNPEYRIREKRASQPWELRVTESDKGITGTLIKIDQIWKQESLDPDLKVTEYETPTPAALRQALDKHGPGLSVILVFTSGSVRHGALMNFLKPVLPTHGTIHVYTD